MFEFETLKNSDNNGTEEYFAFPAPHPTTSPPPPPFPPMPVGDPSIILIFEWVNLMLSMPVILIVCGFGSVGNVINGIVFYRQGILSDSSTTSLTALAVSDFFVCLFSFLESLITIPHKIAMYAEDYDLSYYYAMISGDVAKPTLVFVQTTSWITVFIALERMVSVAFPFHVKLIFTARRSCVVIVTIFIIAFIITLPKFIPNAIWPETPMELLLEELNYISEKISTYGLRITSICLIFLFNVVIILKVVGAKKFRNRSKSTNKTTDVKKVKSKKSVPAGETGTETKQTSSSENVKATKTSDNKGENAMNKELKLVTMIVVLSVLFLFCYSPQSVMNLLLELNTNGFIMSTSVTMLVTMQYTAKFLEGLNSSCNIFIYYTMSTKYRKELQLLCTFLKKAS